MAVPPAPTTIASVLPKLDAGNHISTIGAAEPPADSAAPAAGLRPEPPPPLITTRTIVAPAGFDHVSFADYVLVAMMRRPEERSAEKITGEEVIEEAEKWKTEEKGKK